MHEVEGYSGRLWVSDSPLVSELVLTIRDAVLQRSSYLVRKCVDEIGKLMAYDVERIETAKGNFPTASASVTTGNKGTALHQLRSEEPVFLNILRSADEMVHGAREVFREAPVIFADTKRVEGTYREGTIRIDVNYMSAPNPQPDGEVFSLAGRVLMVPDPMGATFWSGETAAARAGELYGQPSRQIFMNVMAAKPGVEAFLERMTRAGIDCCMYTAVLDPTLDERAYIVPGAGDLGNLQHNGGKSLFRVLREIFYEGRE